MSVLSYKFEARSKTKTWWERQDTERQDMMYCLSKDVLVLDLAILQGSQTDLETWKNLET